METLIYFCCNTVIREICVCRITHLNTVSDIYVFHSSLNTGNGCFRSDGKMSLGNNLSMVFFDLGWAECFWVCILISWRLATSIIIYYLLLFFFSECGNTRDLCVN